MKKLFAVVFALLLSAQGWAEEYGQYDARRLLTVAETPAGKTYGFDGAYLEQILNDLARHAQNYPPQFDSPQDKQRAVRDVRTVAGMLDILLQGPAPNPELLLRAAWLGSMGHNLDIPGSPEKAEAAFKRLLALQPEHPRGNYLYGTFLAGSGRAKEALPPLEKALAAGVVDAAYAIGMTWLSLGDKTRALASLEDYRRSRLGDENAARLIEAVRNASLQLRQNPG